MKKIIGVGVAVAATLGMAVLTAAVESKETSATRIVSELLAYDGTACTTTCEMLICTVLNDNGHLNHAFSGGNDTGEEHGCATPESCEAHACNPTLTLAPDELTTVVQLVPSMPYSELVALNQAESNLHLNLERQAVQILGCQGLVLASVELSPAQKHSVANLD